MQPWVGFQRVYAHGRCGRLFDVRSNCISAVGGKRVVNVALNIGGDVWLSVFCGKHDVIKQSVEAHGIGLMEGLD